MLILPFEYRKLGDFTYHLLSDPKDIKSYMMKWIMREWEIDHDEAPEERWTVSWMEALPKMEFTLEVIRLNDICPNTDLMSVEEFQRSLKERADEREESILRGVSIEPVLVHRTPATPALAGGARESTRDRSASLVKRGGFELMDGYTRYTVLKRYTQEEVYAYLGRIDPV